MLPNTRYIFFGTPEFAANVLRGLLDGGYVPVALVCNPDKPAGREKAITLPVTKQLIIERGLETKILQPEKLDEKFIEEVKALATDFFIVAAFSKILRKNILEIPRLGTIGAHPSLLPKYRGASPIQSAILASEKETGVTLYMLNEGVDSGTILAQRKTKIDGRYYKDLEIYLAQMAGELLVDTIPLFIEEQITPIAQDETQATFTKKFETKDAYVTREELKNAENGKGVGIVLEKIRAFNPEPGAYTEGAEIGGGKRVRLLEGELKNGKLKLTQIQIEGKKPQMIS